MKLSRDNYLSLNSDILGVYRFYFLLVYIFKFFYNKTIIFII